MPMQLVTYRLILAKPFQILDSVYLLSIASKERRAVSVLVLGDEERAVRTILGTEANDVAERYLSDLGVGIRQKREHFELWRRSDC